MKKLILILFLLSLSTVSLSQEKKDTTYKDYKACTECFEQWKKTGLENYGIPSQSTKKDGYLKEHSRRFVGGVIAIFVGAITYAVYYKINKAADEIH